MEREKSLSSTPPLPSCLLPPPPMVEYIQMWFSVFGLDLPLLGPHCLRTILCGRKQKHPDARKVDEKITVVFIIPIRDT